MANNGKRGQALGKAALAKATRIIAGDTTTHDPKVSPMAQSLGITFDANNNVTGNQTTDDIAAIDSKATTNANDIQVLSNKINAIAAVLGITFNGDGTLASEGYSTHTHAYLDGTIADTDDGSGVQTDTQRTTDGVV